MSISQSPRSEKPAHFKPSTISLSDAAIVLAISRTAAWSLYKRGEFPIPVMAVGKSLRVVRAHLEQYLGNSVPIRETAPVALEEISE